MRLFKWAVVAFWLFIAWQFLRAEAPGCTGTVERAHDKMLRKVDDWSRR